MKITGLEANYILYALDHYCATNQRGKITINPVDGYNILEVQSLRDRLFAVHEHPEEEIDEYMDQRWPRGEEN